MSSANHWPCNLLSGGVGVFPPQTETWGPYLAPELGCLAHQSLGIMACVGLCSAGATRREQFCHATGERNSASQPKEGSWPLPRSTSDSDSKDGAVVSIFSFRPCHLFFSLILSLSLCTLSLPEPLGLGPSNEQWDFNSQELAA